MLFLKILFILELFTHNSIISFVSEKLNVDNHFSMRIKQTIAKYILSKQLT